MSLSCSCEYDCDFEPGDWVYYYEGNGDEEYLIPFNGKKRKRCCSCNELIGIGAICSIYPRRRYPYDDIEARIKTGLCLDDSLCDYPPIIPIAPHYHCEKCAEIYLNLTAIGYECLIPNESMQEALNEYHQISGFKPTRKAIEK